MKTHPILSHEIHVDLVDYELIFRGIDVKMAPYDAGIVDQYVYRAQVLCQSRVHNFDLFPVGNVAFIAEGFASFLFN